MRGRLLPRPTAHPPTNHTLGSYGTLVCRGEPSCDGGTSGGGAYRRRKMSRLGNVGMAGGRGGGCGGRTGAREQLRVRASEEGQQPRATAAQEGGLLPHLVLFFVTFLARPAKKSSIRQQPKTCRRAGGADEHEQSTTLSRK